MPTCWPVARGARTDQRWCIAGAKDSPVHAGISCNHVIEQDLHGPPQQAVSNTYRCAAQHSYVTRRPGCLDLSRTSIRIRLSGSSIGQGRGGRSCSRIPRPLSARFSSSGIRDSAWGRSIIMSATRSCTWYPARLYRTADPPGQVRTFTSVQAHGTKPRRRTAARSLRSLQASKSAEADPRRDNWRGFRVFLDVRQRRCPTKALHRPKPSLAPLGRLLAAERQR